MDCALMQQDLIAYCLGELADPARGRLEAHLASCPHCLRDFFALKRSLEPADVTPSAAAAARLREAVAPSVAVAQSVARAQQGTRWSWWERPVAVGFAVAAVALATFATVSLAASPGAAPHGWVVASSRR